MGELEADLELVEEAEEDSLNMETLAPVADLLEERDLQDPELLLHHQEDHTPLHLSYSSSGSAAAPTYTFPEEFGGNGFGPSSADSGYGAPGGSTSSGYGAPGGGSALDTGYGAPAGSGYGAPSYSGRRRNARQLSPSEATEQQPETVY